MFSQEIQMSSRIYDISIHFGLPDKIWRQGAMFAKYKAGSAIYNFSDLIWDSHRNKKYYYRGATSEHERF